MAKYLTNNLKVRLTFVEVLVHGFLVLLILAMVRQNIKAR
jgi:hypothetical protein